MTDLSLSDLFLRLGLGLGLGLLVGLERERSQEPMAGIRTFGLTGLLGGLLALFDPWMMAAGLVGVVALAVTGNLVKLRAGRVDPGQTTEIALLLVYGIGIAAVHLPAPVVLAAGGSTAVLLHFKERIHGAIRELGPRDLASIFRFVLITLVILPVLPDRSFGPYAVLNPREIWWMVVLIVGIGLAGYLGFKLLGQRAGTLLGGFLGGVVSSTATTMSYARQGDGGASARRRRAAVILIASAVVFVRVVLEIAIVGPRLLPAAWGPLTLLLVILVLGIAVTWARDTSETSETELDPGNPADLHSALLFGALYAAVLLAVAWAKDHLGSTGLYAVAVLSGLTDMDAITLSASRLVEAGRLADDQAWRAIVLASISNLAFKTGIVVLWGRSLVARILPWWALAAGVGVAAVWLWP